MWLDEDGVSHTIALPYPADIMSAGFRAGLDALLARDPDAVQLVMDHLVRHMFDDDVALPVDRAEEARFEGLAPPLGLLDGELAEPDALRLALEGVDDRWRLDAITAVDDYVDAGSD